MYIVKLPDGDYINLAFVQHVETCLTPIPIAVIHWCIGKKTTYSREAAKAIFESLDRIAKVNTSDLAEAIALEIFNTFNPADAKTT